MTSFGELIDQTLGDLMGFGRVTIEATHLRSDALMGDLTLKVAHPERLRVGLGEVGSELVWIDSVDSDARTVTIAPYGRGFQGSKPEFHEKNTMVQSNPRWPRYRIAEALNATIRGLAGQLFVPDFEHFTTDSSGMWGVSADARDVLRVRGRRGNVWFPIEHFGFVNTGDLDRYPTGRAIGLGVGSGVDVELVVSVDPIPLSGEGDEFSQVSGLPDSCLDVVKVGALWRLLSSLDAGKYDTDTISAAQLSDNGQPNTASQLSSQMFIMFQQRVKEERQKLVQAYGGEVRRSVWG